MRAIRQAAISMNAPLPRLLGDRNNNSFVKIRSWAAVSGRLAGNTCRLAGEVTSDPHGGGTIPERAARNTSQPREPWPTNSPTPDVYKTSVSFSNCLRRGQVEGSAEPKPVRYTIASIVPPDTKTYWIRKQIRAQ